MLLQGEKHEAEDAVSADEEIRNPLLLEFLGLKDEYSENDLEEALIRHLEGFLLELGNEFAFVARQKRLRIGHEWFRVDLVFFHRRLRSLIIIDLKVGDLAHADDHNVAAVHDLALPTAPTDGACFALSDPVSSAGLVRTTPMHYSPKLLSPRYVKLFSEETYDRIRRDKFRMHFQYLMATELPGDYDYFAITAAGKTLQERFANHDSVANFKPHRYFS